MQKFTNFDRCITFLSNPDLRHTALSALYLHRIFTGWWSYGAI